MAAPLILIVEDEPGIAASLRFLLERDHFAVADCETLQAARGLLAQHDPALLLLDLGLPDGNGEELLRGVRGQTVGRAPQLPIIVLTSRAEEVDRIVGLELGADDYIAKPFSPREVVARIKAVLRRSARAEAAVDEVRSDGAQPRLLHQGLQIDLEKRRVTHAHSSGAIELTKTEFDLLATLCARPGFVFTRAMLLDRVWADVAVTDRTVDVHIKSLRKKLREAAVDDALLETVRGVGYRMRE